MNCLPFTVFHYPVAYLLYVLNRKLKVPGLVVGSFIPDIEIPIITLLGGSNTLPSNRLVLHSLVGAMTVGTLFSIMVVILFYPMIVSKIFKIEKEKVSKQCCFSLSLVFSSLLGAVSHVLLDIVNHSNNPVFWPFQAYLRNPINRVLGPLVYILLSLLFVILVIRHRENLSYLLVGE